MTVAEKAEQHVYRPSHGLAVAVENFFGLGDIDALPSYLQPSTKSMYIASLLVSGTVYGNGIELVWEADNTELGEGGKEVRNLTIVLGPEDLGPTLGNIADVGFFLWDLGSLSEGLPRQGVDEVVD